MNKSLICRLGLVMLFFGYQLFAYLEKQNTVTQLKIEIPQLAAEVSSIKEENERCRYEIDRFENPAHLIGLLSSPEYASLKHPLLDDVFSMPAGLAISIPFEESAYDGSKSALGAVVGAK